MSLLLLAFLVSLFWVWVFAGFAWLLFSPSVAEDLGWRHVLLGGPVFWVCILLVVTHVVCLGAVEFFRAIAKAAAKLDEAITKWSLRPVHRAVDEYSTNGGYNG